MGKIGGISGGILQTFGRLSGEMVPLQKTPSKEIKKSIKDNEKVFLKVTVATLLLVVKT